ncbi:TRAP transporter small permease [Franzmannia qiaohouensis]|uniref:TRAP transporter small permease protein n=1 Tax=Franzmannia qiaohouensis TaxID=1329370 RepID=A0ABU1HGC1_9GAMM|nr:TRAP transporter small permease [Halomonas qiaohouensis]MDR5906526.1 TRAP transporter small permease [Halomonas qiaohouensis]
MTPNVFQGIERATVRLLDSMVVALAGLLLVLLNYAVFSRFVLNASVSWGEELPANLLAVLTFIGAAYLTKINEHLGFDSVLRLMPLAVQRVLLCINQALMLVFALVVAYYGMHASLGFHGRSLISIDLPMALFRWAMPLGCGLIAIICATRLFGLATGKIAPNELYPETD